MKRYCCKRIIVNMLIVSLLLGSFSVPIIVQAANNLAVSVGMDYGDGVDTKEDATNASSAYSDAGYSIVTLTSPSLSSFTEKRLKADILFFSGHANSNLMDFGSFSIICRSGTTTSNVNLWDTATYQKLITFAGCNTAGGDSKSKDSGTGTSTDSITKRAVEQGADVAVGWTTTVSAGSHTNWLKRYNNALADGYTVSKAIDKANSYIYLPGSGVKNVKYYGNGNTKITSSKSTTTNSMYSDTSILETAGNAEIINDIIDIAMESKSEFSTHDFVGFVSTTNNGYIVDVYYKSNGTLTNVAITLQLDNAMNVLGIKTHNLPTTSLNNVFNVLEHEEARVVSSTFKEQMMTTEKRLVKATETVTKQTQYEYYDITNKTTYLVTYTEVENSLGAIYVYENCIPME